MYTRTGDIFFGQNMGVPDPLAPDLKSGLEAFDGPGATGRLLQSTTNLQTLSSAAADTAAYTYNQAGGLTSASDAQNTGGTQLQCYTDNNLQELTTAWTDTQGTSTAPGPSVPGIGGCVTTAPSATTTGGPALYWQSYTYDLLGDRTAETSHDTSGNTADNVTQAFTYPGNGTAAAAQPDAASQVATTGPGGTATTADKYDAAGDTTSRTTTATGSSPPPGPNQSFTYNAQGQTASVTSGGQKSSYTYDADGNLLVQADPGSTTVYLDGGAEQLTYAAKTVTGLRFYAAPDGTTVVRSSAGAISYEVTNPQHTAVEAINAATLAVTRRYFDPYGNPAGTAPSSWPDANSYLGKPGDVNTGLDLLGARQYDPPTGRFLSVDPVLEASSPQQMGGYAYAGDNPATSSDPTGLSLPGGAQCGSSSDPCQSGGGGGGGNSGGGGSGGSGAAGSGTAGVSGFACGRWGECTPQPVFTGGWESFLGGIGGSLVSLIDLVNGAACCGAGKPAPSASIVPALGPGAASARRIAGR